MCIRDSLIADEPTTSLDVTIQSQILELLQSLQDKMGMTIVLITHNLGVVARLARNIVVMYAGKVVESGSSSDIFYRPAHPYTRALLQAVPRLDAPSRMELASIPGTPPDLFEPPTGCAFAPRCKSVSYTHLDVYKRQPITLLQCKEHNPARFLLKSI